MPDTIYMNPTSWDLDVDADGDIAVAAEPYALAQDAASAIKTFQGEAYFDTTIGVPLRQEILGQSPSTALIKSQLQAAAEAVPGVASAEVFITGIAGRVVQGQVQVKSTSGATSSATF
jgi:hypothetical protein